MGGPGASVLLRKMLTTQQEDELEIWLRSMTHDLEQDKWGYQFWLNANAFPGTVSRCRFYLSLSETTTEWDEDEQKQIKEQLGYLPEQFINVSSGCNQDADHLTLGHFVLHLAELYGGLIDMQGAIIPPLKPVNRARLDEWVAEGPERAEERRAFMRARMKELEASLPPGKTMRDLFREQHTDPDSPLKALMAEAEARFGPVIPPEFTSEARNPSLEEINAYVMRMLGKVYANEYTAAAGHRWVWHIVDPVFLRAWMQHPSFRMIK